MNDSKIYQQSTRQKNQVSTIYQYLVKIINNC